MKKQKVLLIEDLEAHYKRVKSFFDKYEVDFYPKSLEEYDELARMLLIYGRSIAERKPEFLQKIAQYIGEIKPDIVMIDLGFDGDPQSLEKPGLDIIELLNNDFDPAIKKIIITAHADTGDIAHDGYIRKRSAVPIENQIKEIIIQPFKIKNKGAGAAASTAVNEVLQPDAEKISLSALEKFSIFEDSKISPWVSTVLDLLITYTFYLLIIGLFIMGPVDIYKNAIETELNNEKPIDAFKIAERTFVAFLPFLICCGFYIFYTKSLRNYFFKSIVDPRIEDFEKSSVLMKLTKKLFVSSLISYLFIKLIELLCFERPHDEESYFKSFYKNTDPFLQLYFTAGLIAILILYFIYIDRNHKSENELNRNKKRL